MMWVLLMYRTRESGVVYQSSAAYVTDDDRDERSAGVRTELYGAGGERTSAQLDRGVGRQRSQPAADPLQQLHRGAGRHCRRRLSPTVAQHVDIRRHILPEGPPTETSRRRQVRRSGRQQYIAVEPAQLQQESDNTRAAAPAQASAFTAGPNVQQPAVRDYQKTSADTRNIRLVKHCLTV